MSYGVGKIYKVLLFISLVALIGCAKQSSRLSLRGVERRSNLYILMEKQIADISVGAGHNLPRHRTTAKIIIKNVGAQFIEPALKQALQDLQRDDPELDAVIIWAYNNRKELNQSFTLGKLEWSKDKKGWDGKQKLSQEINSEVK